MKATNHPKLRHELIEKLCEYFGLKLEPIQEFGHRITGKSGTFHGYRVRGAKGKLLVDIGGADSPDLCEDSLLQLMLISLGKYMEKLPLPPQPDRKNWLRNRVIQGGKSTETSDPAGEPGHGK